jgi:hypothetical protein
LSLKKSFLSFFEPGKGQFFWLWLKKAQNGSKKLKTAQKSSKRLKKAQNGSKKLKKAQKSSKSLSLPTPAYTRSDNP